MFIRNFEEGDGKFMLNKIKDGLVISCQALYDEPLHSPFIMGRMALAKKRQGQ